MRKKQKQNHNKFKWFARVLSIALILSSGAMAYQAYRLQILPDVLLYLCLIILALIVLIILLIFNFKVKRTLTKVLSSALVIICVAALSIGSLYFTETQTFLQTVTDSSRRVKNEVSMITLKDSDLEKERDLDGKKIGYLKNIDSYGTKKARQDLKAKNISYKGKKYTSVQAEVKALYDKEVDAIILNESYRANVEDLKDYTKFSKETKIIATVTYYTKDSNEADSVSDITSKPFTILISGNDTYGDIGEVSRSDVNMLVTVNPTTNRVLLTSLPRDYYVEVKCSDGACQDGSLDKLTHTGIHGVNTTKETIENLLGIDINYTFRVNFSSLEEIVDALGGIDIYVKKGMAVDTFYADSTLKGVHEGWNHLNGERALAYARERHAYEDGDVQRVKNQQQVLEAIVDKAISSKALTNYQDLLKAFSNAFDTNMSTQEITALIKYQLQSSPDWKFENFVLKGESAEKYSAELGDYASVVVTDDAYVTAARKKIKAILKGKKASSVKVGKSKIHEYENDTSEETQTETSTDTSQQDTTNDSSATYDTSTTYDTSQSAAYDTSQTYTAPTYDTSQYSTDYAVTDQSVYAQ
jgi:LCP family protein required for cell wall assembly